MAIDYMCCWYVHCLFLWRTKIYIRYWYDTSLSRSNQLIQPTSTLSLPPQYFAKTRQQKFPSVILLGGGRNWKFLWVWFNIIRPGRSEAERLHRNLVYEPISHDCSGHWSCSLLLFCGNVWCHIRLPWKMEAKFPITFLLHTWIIITVHCLPEDAPGVT